MKLFSDNGFSLFSFMLITYCFASCTDSALKDAGAFAANIMGASSFDVEKSSSSSGAVYVLNVNDAAWNSKHSASDVMSVGALAFFNRINDQSDKWYVRLVVKAKDDVYRQTYGSDELQLADRCIDHVTSFFKWKPTQGIDSLRPFVDPLFFPDSLISKIGKSVQEQDSLDNGFIRNELVGFEADTVAGIPVLTIKVNAVRKQSKQRYDAFVGMQSEQVLLVVPSED